jgi:hypothetical protein
MTSLSFAFVIFYLEESPLFLYNKGLYGSAKASLIKIAKFNGIQMDQDLFIFDQESTEEAEDDMPMIAKGHISVPMNQ